MEEDKLNFLEFMDNEYEKTCVEEKIQKDNKEFAIFQKIEPIGISVNNDFFCYKRKRTKILFCPDNCKVYLTDQDIINIFLKLDDNTLDIFLEKFIDLYNGKENKFKFKISDNTFEGIGIQYEEDKDQKILLYTDNEISINELIFIINMILEKDRLYELQEKTLIKYISLIKYYKYNDQSAQNFLEEIKYPFNDFDIYIKTYNSKMLKEIDKKFINKGLIFKKNMII